MLELTGAYAAFANGGMRVTPYAVRDISSAAPFKVSATLMQKAPSPALDPQIAYLISDILSDRYARMRAFGGALDIDRPAAVKTGTTTDWRDNWTVGYTPDRAVGVWIGNADGQRMEAVSGVTGAASLAAGDAGGARRVAAAPVCPSAGDCRGDHLRRRGLLPSPVCPATRLERFIAGTVPQRPDDTHVLVRIDPVRECRAPDNYPQARTVLRIYRLLPAEAEPWAADTGVPRPPRAVCPAFADVAGEQRDDKRPVGGMRTGEETNVSSWQSSPLLITSPAHGAVFAVSPGVPVERQRIAITAGATVDIEGVTIFVNGEPVAAASRTFWQLQPGIHRAWAEGRDASGRIVHSPVVEFEVRSAP